MENNIKAEQLRLGNYFLHDGNIVQFDEDIMHDVKYGGLEGDEPIPLTEEWLLKFGFEKDQYEWYSKKYFTDCKESVEQMIICYNLKSKRLAIYDAIEETSMQDILSYPIYTAKILEYVHTLQNLVHALTNEELTMK